jgi:two-component system sensor histidine kinase/response regulator
VRELQEALQAANQQLEDRVARRTQELEQALYHLDEMNRLKTNFVANISHELRTPLTHIKGYGALLRDTLGALNAEQQNAVQIMLEAASRLGRLIEDLISYASTAQGKMLINPTAFSLETLAQSILAQPNFMLARARLLIRAEIEENLPLALADYEKVEWVIQHLLDNAVKFTPDGGEVVLRASLRDERLQVSVQDTGIGIPPERVNELFEPFHQLDGASNRHYGGTGLGLTLVKQFVEAHDSAIKVQSYPDLGSTFVFDLPVTML